MKLIKFNGIKDERIIKGKRYIRTDKTVMAVKQYNSYVASGFNSYDEFIKKAYGKLTRGINIKEQDLVVFSEIISKGKMRSLYLTLYKWDRDYKSN